MPRPNRTRHIGGEASLAERIAFEREDREWSPAGLASRMEKAGCPINTSAIYKLEKADPPRRITVDEFVAFARVFDLPLDELLIPTSVVKHDKLLRGLGELSERFFVLQAAQRDYDETVARLVQLGEGLGFELQIPAETSVEVSSDTVWGIGIKNADD